MKTIKNKTARKRTAAVLLCSIIIILTLSCVNPLGELIGTPEILIIHEEKIISSGGIFSFGEIVAGAERPELTFLIQNRGKTDLTLPSGIIITGANASMFQVKSPPPEVIAPGEESSFSVAFVPYGTGGVKEATVSIETNDRIAGTFTFTVQGKFSGVSVSILTSEKNPTNSSWIPISITFREQVEAFSIEDIAVSNCYVASFQPHSDDMNWDVYLVPEDDGILSAMVPEGAVNAKYSSGSNIASEVFSLVYDGTNPTGSVIINCGASGTNNLSVDLVLNGDDGAGTGVDKMIIWNKDDEEPIQWEDFSSSRAWELPLIQGVDDGKSAVVYARFRDLAGNPSERYYASITYDITEPDPPSAPILSSEDYYEYDSGLNTYKTRQSTAITFSGTAEAGSVVKIYSDIDGMAGSGYANASGEYFVDADLSYAGEGTEHSISLTATDGAGNESGETAFSSTITVEPPALTGIYISASSSPGTPVIPDEIWSTEPVQLHAFGQQESIADIDITKLVTWTSLSPSVAVVSSEGLVTGTGAGTVKIKAVIYNAEGTMLVYTTTDITVIPAGGIDIGLE